MLIKSIPVLVVVFALTGAAWGQAKLTDPQIAHIAYTAGLVDIAAAKQALDKSQNADVRAFAEEMVRDHTAVNDKALALCKKLGVTPEDNDTSKSLAASGQQKLEEYAKLSGADYDHAYANNEVAYHKSVNSTLAGTLIPSTSNAELKDLLNTGLNLFKGHEQHAEELVGKLK